MRQSSATYDAAEIAKFASLADEWWNPSGSMKMLHRLNPVRLGYVRDRACAHFGRPARELKPLTGLSVLDIGCGGGLVSEPLAKMGASVTGIDPTPDNTETARHHAQASGLLIDYRPVMADDLATSGAQFDVVLALEVIEHVADVDAFLAACAAMVKPGGLFIGATINRTQRARILAIGMAEYVLGWLPRGTHDFDKFVTPEEFSAGLARHGLGTTDVSGVVFSPLSGAWALSRDDAVNYMLTARKA